MVTGVFMLQANGQGSLSKYQEEASRKIDNNFAPTRFIPQCEADGSYKRQQCDNATGACFCVDPTTGGIDYDYDIDAPSCWILERAIILNKFVCENKALVYCLLKENIWKCVLSAAWKFKSGLLLWFMNDLKSHFSNLIVASGVCKLQLRSTNILRYIVSPPSIQCTGNLSSSSALKASTSASVRILHEILTCLHIINLVVYLASVVSLDVHFNFVRTYYRF